MGKRTWRLLVVRLLQTGIIKDKENLNYRCYIIPESVRPCMMMPEAGFPRKWRMTKGEKSRYLATTA